jgi:hypothetical protein
MIYGKRTLVVLCIVAVLYFGIGSLECFGNHIDRTRPELSFAAVELARFPTCFTRCNNAVGYILQLQFYSYGDTDDEVMGNLDQLIAGIQTAASEVNRQIREWNLCPK